MKVKNFKLIIAIILIAFIEAAIHSIIFKVYMAGFERVPFNFWTNYFPYVLSAISFVSGATAIITQKFGMRYRHRYELVQGKTAIILGIIMVFIGIFIFYVTVSPSVNLINLDSSKW